MSILTKELLEELPGATGGGVIVVEIGITINFGPHWTEYCSGVLDADPPDSDWVAIDFETATSARDSACAVGIAHVRRGRVAAVERALIQPPDNDYDGFNVMIHGIEPEMTEDSPTFTALWPLLLSRITPQRRNC